METISFKLDDAKEIFERLSCFYNIDEVNEWKNKVKDDLNQLFLKWDVTQYQLNKNSYMGIVLDCKCKTKDIYIKIVPPMIKRFFSETGTLKKLPKDVICEIYEIDENANAIIMEKIIPGDLARFSENKKMYTDLFENLANNKIIVDEEINEKFKNFSEVVDYDYNILQSTNFDLDIPAFLYKLFKEKYSELCMNNDLYLLHGDIYLNNAVLSNENIKIVDPLGFIAPFVIELTPICAYEMFNNDGNRKNVDIFNEFYDFFSQYVDYETYKNAMLCQLIKVYIPSIYEANDNGKRANKWLNIINDLYRDYFIENYQSKNIDIILAGGVGSRFGADIPKQYLDLNGQPVINYAITAAKEAKSIDEIVIVMDEQYLNYIGISDDKHIHIVHNGDNRIQSVKKALEYIKNSFPECENIIITQAVNPMITSDIIDDYIAKLDQYDVVTTAQECVGELFNIEDYQKIDRNNYYFCQSPEAFKFNQLYKNIDVNSQYSELIYHYNNKPQIYYYLAFKNNIKITTDSDLEYCKYLLKKK